MEFNRHDIERIIRDVFQNWFKEEYCPYCAGETTFVRVSYSSDEGAYEEGWRCLRCLKSFKQTMVPVVPKVGPDVAVS